MLSLFCHADAGCISPLKRLRYIFAAAAYASYYTVMLICHICRFLDNAILASPLALARAAAESLDKSRHRAISGAIVYPFSSSGRAAFAKVLQRCRVHGACH